MAKKRKKEEADRAFVLKALAVYRTLTPAKQAFALRVLKGMAAVRARRLSGGDHG